MGRWRLSTPRDATKPGSSIQSFPDDVNQPTSTRFSWAAAPIPGKKTLLLCHFLASAAPSSGEDVWLPMFLAIKLMLLKCGGLHQLKYMKPFHLKIQEILHIKSALAFLDSTVTAATSVFSMFLAVLWMSVRQWNTKWRFLYTVDGWTFPIWDIPFCRQPTQLFFSWSSL